RPTPKCWVSTNTSASRSPWTFCWRPSNALSARGKSRARRVRAIRGSSERRQNGLPRRTPRTGRTFFRPGREFQSPPPYCLLHAQAALNFLCTRRNQQVPHRVAIVDGSLAGPGLLAHVVPAVLGVLGLIVIHRGARQRAHHFVQRIIDVRRGTSARNRRP